MSRIACQVHAHETRWRGFLVDADCEASLETLREATGEKATEAKKHDDPDIVEEAWEDARTIVTSNRDDFLHHIAVFQNRPNKKDPPDLWGLLVIPNNQNVRERALLWLKGGLRTNVGLLHWPSAAFLNLYIRLTMEGKIHIRRFKWSAYFGHPTQGVKIKQPWKTWYQSLQQVK
jgi:hypothetical protein